MEGNGEVPLLCLSGEYCLTRVWSVFPQECADSQRQTYSKLLESSFRFPKKTIAAFSQEASALVHWLTI